VILTAAVFVGEQVAKSPVKADVIEPVIDVSDIPGEPDYGDRVQVELF